MSEEEYNPLPDLDEQSEIEIPSSVAGEEAAGDRIDFDDVRWVNTFANNPDYAHLPATAEGGSFDLTPALIESAIALGHYVPHFTDEGHLIIAIRGAGIANAEEIKKSSIRLTEQKPDHRTTRCVIGVYHKTEQKVSAFRASTVPNRGGVASCANLLNGHGGTLANILPTGCYQLCVGTHHGSAEIPTVLRLGKGPEPDTALEVTVLRSKNDGIYGTSDLWDRCKPADNVHPAFSASSADFSSLGCLTVPGRFSGGTHSGAWARFRETAGFNGNQHRGTRYDLLLTTGMELAAIAEGASDLRRLSHGSTGPFVKALQNALGIVPSDSDFGPGTKKKLAEKEAATRGMATGVYSPATQAALGFSVF